MEILFSKESFDDLDSIEEYLLRRWNEQVLDDFNYKLDRCINIILEQSVVFQKYENTQYHKVLITKHNSLIYTIEKDILKIHRILQNFQNPDENYKNITEK